MKKIVVLGLLFSLIFPLKIAAQVDSETDELVYQIPMNQEIDQFLVVFLKRSLLKAKEAQASIIIFQLNTFGGRVDSALEIASMIGSVDWANTIAYIPSASGGTGVSWSAGALISFSCDQIIMDYGTSIGAAAPVYQSSEGMVMAEEKTVSAVRGQMAALAEKNGYPLSVALAMVDDDVVLYEIETENGIRLKTPDEITELERVSGVAPAKGRLIIAEDKLLTLTAGEMEKYGISSATVNGSSELYSFLQISESSVIELEQNRADGIIAFLSSAAVTSILVMIALVALYMEVTSPGFGVPGTVAIICFAVVFLTSTLMGNLGSLELILFLLGIVLLLLEIFVIPGFGITGISGILLLIISLVLSRQDFIIPEFEWQWDQFKKNLLYFVLSFIGAITFISILMVTLPKSRLFTRLVLTNKKDKSPTSFKKQNIEVMKNDQVGMNAYAITDLRPVGKAEINGEVVVVQTDGEYLEKGSELIVLRREGLRIVVKAR